MNPRLFCGIPARVGSKRLPLKNIKLLDGKPMLAYSIEAARATGLFETIVVATDNEDIAAIAREHGAHVPHLMDPYLCRDDAASHDPLMVLMEEARSGGAECDTLVCLQPSSPLRSAEDILAGVKRYEQGDVDFVVSVTFIDPHYFHWAVAPKPENKEQVRLWFGEEYMVERTLLPPVYRPNGSIKIGGYKALLDVGHFFGEKLGVVETPEERSIHVATQYEFDQCEFLLSRMADAAV